MAELGVEEPPTFWSSQSHPGLGRAAGLVVEGNPAGLAPPGEDVQAPHGLGSLGDARRELQVVHGQSAQLGKTNPSLEKQLDGGVPDGRLPEVAGLVTEQLYEGQHVACLKGDSRRLRGS